LSKEPPYILEIYTNNYGKCLSIEDKCYCIYTNTIKEAKEALKKLNLHFDKEAYNRLDVVVIGKLFPIADTHAYVRILETYDGKTWIKTKKDLLVGVASYEICDLDDVGYSWHDYEDYVAKG